MTRSTPWSSMCKENETTFLFCTLLVLEFKAQWSFLHWQFSHHRTILPYVTQKLK